MKRDRGFSPMDEEAKKRIAELAALPESEIDTSHIPEWTEENVLFLLSAIASIAWIGL